MDNLLLKIHGALVSPNRTMPFLREQVKFMSSNPALGLLDSYCDKPKVAEVYF